MSDRDDSAERRVQVLVIGGRGYFGRLLVDDLLKFTTCKLTVASRRPASSDRYATVVADLNNQGSLETVLTGVDVVVCAAGPYQDMSTKLVEICIRRGIHYIDFADDRLFAEKVRALAASVETRSAICSAWSTVCALSGALARVGCAEHNGPESIHVHMAPGNRGPRNRATIESLMHSLGTPFTVWRDSRWQTVRGWSEPTRFDFPLPVGPRAGYLVSVPDLDLFPQLLHARTVEFRAGSELAFLNAAASALAWLARKGLVRNWTPFSGVLRRAAALFGFAGHDWGAVGVEVQGSARRRVSVIAEQQGQRIAVMPASIMVEMLSTQRIPLRGWISPADWITEARLRMECHKRGFQLIVEEW